MARRALAALAMAALVAAASAPDPCCLRVTPYHIQALAQRMAQRFQALEYRAQDLRGVFVSFQAVHGNVSHRLRYLEAEHAHLSEVVSRLDSRLQNLEEEKRMEQYRLRYGRGCRDAPPEAAAQSSHQSGRDEPFRIRIATRRRREEEATELPHLLVRLDQIKETTIGIGQLPISTATPTHSSESETQSEVPFENSKSHEHVQFVPQDHTSEPETVPTETKKNFSTLLPIISNALRNPTPATQHSASVNASATTPTPLWQLEETANALREAMSTSDGDIVDPILPNNTDDDGVSYYSPKNETEYLEELFKPTDISEYPGTVKCKGQETVNCSAEHPEEHPTQADDVQLGQVSSETVALESTTLSVLNLSDIVSDPAESGASESSASHLDENISDLQSDGAVKDPDPAVKETGCKSTSRVSSLPDAPPPLANFTSHLTNSGNSSNPLADIFSSATDGQDSGPSSASDGGSNGTASSCGAEGCDDELSDAELQAALRELDALLQRPPASAPPPDPEKLLLKRALTLALAALERTSDACLKLVNFTADAFEELTAEA